MVINDVDLLKLAPITGMYQKKMASGGTSYGLSEAGYDIRIKQDVRFRCLFGFIPQVKLGNGPWKFGRFTLASTIEEFDMKTNMVGIVHDKSTWARRALSVFNTVIEPGWKGFLTLELVFHGRNTVFVPAGSGIAQVLFHELALERSYSGKYQNQEDRPVQARSSR